MFSRCIHVEDNSVSLCLYGIKILYLKKRFTEKDKKKLLKRYPSQKHFMFCQNLSREIVNPDFRGQFDNYNTDL